MRYRSSYGFTLIELVLIILVIGIISSIALKSIGNSFETSREEATLKEMRLLSEAIIGDSGHIKDGIRSDFGYVGDVGALPSSLDDLYSNPGGYTTWDGPYIGDGYDTDGWGNSYTYSGGVALTSTGNGSPITRQFAENSSDLLANTVTGIICDGLGALPGGDASDVAIVLYYPDGVGGVASSSVNPGSYGEFSFAGSVPIGRHLLVAINIAENETTRAYVSVEPAVKTYCELHFSGSYWYTTVLSADTSGGSGGNVFEVRISRNFDDAEEDDSGSVYRTNNTIALGQMQYVGLRFLDVALAPGVTIASAYIEFKASVSNSQSTDLRIWGEDIDNAPQFNQSDSNISSRSRTSASTVWSDVESWTADQTYQSVDISTIIQEIIDRGGWAESNDLVIMIESTNPGGLRLFTAHDNSSAEAALLHVEYNN